MSKRIHIISGLLLVLFTSYYVSVTLFSHIHFSNGVMLVHSHPYSKNTSHEHSGGQLLILSLLARGLQIENISILSLLSVILPIVTLFFATIEQSDSPTILLSNITLRAPPLMN